MNLCFVRVKKLSFSCKSPVCVTWPELLSSCDVFEDEFLLEKEKLSTRIGFSTLFVICTAYIDKMFYKTEFVGNILQISSFCRLCFVNVYSLFCRFYYCWVVLSRLYLNIIKCNVSVQSRLLYLVSTWTWHTGRLYIVCTSYPILEAFLQSAFLYIQLQITITIQ